MARITRVRHAQQRYETVPDIDPATGEQKTVTTTRKTRSGQPVVQRLTRPDLSRPLPPEKCGRCGTEIRPRSATHPGDPYKWIAPKSGPYGGRRMVRCTDCPDWQDVLHHAVPAGHGQAGLLGGLRRAERALQHRRGDRAGQPG